MDPQTILKLANATSAVLVGAMVGTVVYCEIKQRQMNRTMADIDAKIARGNLMMKNWNRMPTFD